MNAIISFFVMNAMGTQIYLSNPESMKCVCTPDVHTFIESFRCTEHNWEDSKYIRFENDLEQPLSTSVLIQCYDVGDE